MPVDKLFNIVFVGALLGVVLLTVAALSMPGQFVYVPDATPLPTPMDVTLKMRDQEGNITEIWLCQYDRKQGWLCEPQTTEEKQR